MPPKNKGALLDPEMRGKIAQSLVPAIMHAIQSYRDFSHEQVIADAKTFSAYHTACKAAVSHIELLLKLAAWADVPRAEDAGDLAALMADAEGEVARYHAGMGECDDSNGGGDA